MLKHAIDGPVTRRAGRARRAPEGEPRRRAVPARALRLGSRLPGRGLARGRLPLPRGAPAHAHGPGRRHDLRTHLFAHLQRLELAWFDRHPTGSLVTRVTNDVENLNELFTSGLIVLLFDMIKVAVVACCCVREPAARAAGARCCTPLLVGVSLVFRGGARRAHRAVRARLARLNGYLQEVLSGIRVVQVFRRERASRRASPSTCRPTTRPTCARSSCSRSSSRSWPGHGADPGLDPVARRHAIAGGVVTLGEFILFWFWLQVFVGPIRELGERYNILQAAFASAERIFRSSTPLRSSPSPPRRARSAARSAATCASSTSPSPTTRASPVLARALLRDRAGRDRGARRRDRRGQVDDREPAPALLRADARPHHDRRRGPARARPRALRERLGLVLQEDFLFPAPCARTSMLGRARVSPESMARALEVSAADDVRAAPAARASTPSSPSAARRSRRASASCSRSRARWPAIPALVILDEATASVDSATEARIEAATHQLLRGAARSSWRTASRPCAAPTGSSSCTTASCARPARTQSCSRAVASTPSCTRCSFRDPEQEVRAG
jgi:ATP-binding cassette subfamily B protein